METSKCDNTCIFHEKFAERLKTMEDAVKITADLKDAVRNLTDNVAKLHQAVINLSHERNNSMPASVRISIMIPSFLVSVSCALWIYGQMSALF